MAWHTLGSPQLPPPPKTPVGPTQQHCLKTQNTFPDTPCPSWDRALLVPGSSMRAGTRFTATFPACSIGLIRKQYPINTCCMNETNEHVKFPFIPGWVRMSLSAKNVCCTVAQNCVQRSWNRPAKGRKSRRGAHTWTRTPEAGQPSCRDVQAWVLRGRASPGGYTRMVDDRRSLPG